MKRLLMGGAAIAVVAATLMACHHGRQRAMAARLGLGSRHRRRNRRWCHHRRSARRTVAGLPAAAGYAYYPAYAEPVPDPNCYWARVPVYDAYGNPISWRGRPRLVCPPY